VPRHVAFLRAINVGGHVVKMERLRTLFEELGLKDVETFIASGNVLFDAPSTGIAKLETRIEAHLEKALGYEVLSYIRPLASLAHVANDHPFDSHAADGHALSIGFLKVALEAERGSALKALANGYDEFHHQRAAGLLVLPRPDERFEALRQDARSRDRFAGDVSQCDDSPQARREAHGELANHVSPTVALHGRGAAVEAGTATRSRR
jgi:Uncharacterized protein conserved in bacteria